MKPVVKVLHNGPVSGTTEVRCEATKAETDELRNALKIVQRWERVANIAAKHKEKLADFTMYKFAVKTDLIIITIESGACG